MLDSRSTSRQSRTFSVLAMVLILGACVTIPTTKDQPVAEIGAPLTAKYIPCSQDKIIPFHAPKDSKAPPETAANIYDTPETIGNVRDHNAAHREACDK